MTQTGEGELLDGIAKDSWYTGPLAIATTEHCYRVFRRHIERDYQVLEIGPAEGAMTQQFVDDGYAPDLVEGASEFTRMLKERFPHLAVHNMLSEDFEPEKQYDAIVLGHVLEHVQDPVALLKKARAWLVPGKGKVLAAVPNARSLHRQAAVIMGLIPHEEEMSEKDIHHGHRRVYTPETLRRDFIAAGFSLDFFGGYWMKPLSDSQLEEHWTPEMIQAFMSLGERYPDIAAEIVVVARA